MPQTFKLGRRNTCLWCCIEILEAMELDELPPTIGPGENRRARGRGAPSLSDQAEEKRLGRGTRMRDGRMRSGQRAPGTPSSDAERVGIRSARAIRKTKAEATIEPPGRWERAHVRGLVRPGASGGGPQANGGSASDATAWTIRGPAVRRTLPFDAVSVGVSWTDVVVAN
ncbi:hypothetical protein ACHAWF_000386 [Thalassiosira exigua]